MLNMWKAIHCPLTSCTAHFLLSSLTWLSPSLLLFPFSYFSVSSKRPHLVIICRIQFLNCTQSEHQPVMEELRHQLRVHDHPHVPGGVWGGGSSRSHPQQAPSLVRCSCWRERWQQVKWDLIHPCPLAGPPPGPACWGCFPLHACLHAVAELPCPDSRVARSAALQLQLSSGGDGKRQRGRRMRETEVSRYWTLFLCVPAAPTSCKAETPSVLCEILPPPCHCVCPGWGGGMRSLRLRLGVLTKGERRDHLSSKPWRQGTLQEARR